MNAQPISWPMLIGALFVLALLVWGAITTRLFVVRVAAVGGAILVGLIVLLGTLSYVLRRPR